MANRTERKRPRKKENKKSLPNPRGNQEKTQVKYFQHKKKSQKEENNRKQKQKNKKIRKTLSPRRTKREDAENKEQESSSAQEEHEEYEENKRDAKENKEERKNITLLRPSEFLRSTELGGSNTNFIANTSQKANAGFVVAVLLPKFKAGHRLDGFTRQQAIRWIQTSNYRKNFIFGSFKRFGPLGTTNYWKFTQRPVYDWVEELGIYRYVRLSPNSNILKLLFFYNKKQKNSVWTSSSATQENKELEENS